MVVIWVGDWFVLYVRCCWLCFGWFWLLQCVFVLFVCLLLFILVTVVDVYLFWGVVSLARRLFACLLVYMVVLRVYLVLLRLVGLRYSWLFTCLVLCVVRLRSVFFWWFCFSIWYDLGACLVLLFDCFAVLCAGVVMNLFLACGLLFTCWVWIVGYMVCFLCLWWLFDLCLCEWYGSLILLCIVWLSFVCVFWFWLRLFVLCWI